MITQTVTVKEKDTQNIIVGRRGTYGTEEIVFDLSYLVDSYGDGSAVLMVKRPVDQTAYPAVTTREGNNLIWEVGDVDTSFKGHGECELFWYADNALAKSVIYSITVLRDIGETTETPPDPYETWIDDLTELGAETLENARAAAQSASDAEIAKEAAEDAQESAEAASQAIQDMSVSAQSLAPGQPASVEKEVDPETGAVSLLFNIPAGDEGASYVIEASAGAIVKNNNANTFSPTTLTLNAYVIRNGVRTNYVAATIGALIWGSGMVPHYYANNTNTYTFTIQSIADTGRIECYFTGQRGRLAELYIPVVVDGMNGTDGEDGFSPIASVSKSEDTVTITVTDKTGTTTASVKDGKDGTDGQDGVSPTVSTQSITGGTEVTITDRTGSHVFDVMNGVDGTDGQDGYSPSASVSQSGTVTTITITDKTGTTSESIDLDGFQPAPSTIGTSGQVLGLDNSLNPVWVDQSGGGGGTTDYDDLTNKPEINSVTLSGNKSLADLGIAAITDIPDVSGFYTKPSGGIPSSDLSSDVQTSLGKADTALQSAPVTSVNTKTGAVTLTASDVGAGTYSKPSGGIPASDLASAVQTSLGKADTALQSAPVTSVNSKTGAVTLSASDVGALPDSYTAPVTSVNSKTGAVTLTASDVGAGTYSKPSGGIPSSDMSSDVQTSLGKADTALQSAPVTSVNTKTGAVTLTASDVGAGTYSKPSGGIPASDLSSAVQTSLGKADTALQSAPVTSVNTKTGAVTLSASDVGALPDSYTAPVTSVNSKTGAVTLTASDVGAGTYSKPSGGIPSSDMSSAVQASLGKADTALQSAPVTSVNSKTGAVTLTASDVGAGTYSKPSGGIPSSDLSSDVQTSLGKADTALQSAPVTSVNTKTGAVTLTASDVSALPSNTTYVSTVNGNSGAVTITVPTKTSDLTNDSNFITGMTILSYGSSTWQNFLDAYNANKVVYCKASSNSNPATGTQGRMAFMAFVNFSGTTPTSVEFQYYRSVSSHSESQQGDQVFVYKLESNGTWSVTTREASSKIVASTGLSSSYSNGTLTLTNSQTPLPTVSGSDNGKVLTVSSGAWAAESVPTELPSVTTTDNGKVLTVDSGAWSAQLPSKEVMCVTITQISGIEYRSDKTFSEIIAAVSSGVDVFAKYGDSKYDFEYYINNSIIKYAYFNRDSRSGNQFDRYTIMISGEGAGTFARMTSMSSTIPSVPDSLISSTFLYVYYDDNSSTYRISEFSENATDTTTFFSQEAIGDHVLFYGSLDCPYFGGEEEANCDTYHMVKRYTTTVSETTIGHLVYKTIVDENGTTKVKTITVSEAFDSYDSYEDATITYSEVEIGGTPAQGVSF